MEWWMLPAVTSLNTTTDACWFSRHYCLYHWGLFRRRGLRGEPRGTGRSGHAGHLTGCGGRLWRERWLNGSDVGRLQGTAEVGNIQTGGLVTDTAGLTPTFQVRGTVFTLLYWRGFVFDWTSEGFWYKTPCLNCMWRERASATKPIWFYCFLLDWARLLLDALFLFIPLARVEIECS